MFALFSGLIGTAYSVLIRLELSGPGVQFISDNQLYNTIITAHAMIRNGQTRHADLQLDQMSDQNTYEVKYLRGLLEYRNGSSQKANKIWKPLLTARTNSIRCHNIKREILKYYFEGEPYLKAN